MTIPRTTEIPRSRDSIGTADTVVPAAARTTAGNSGPLPGYGSATSLRAQLDVTAAAGVTPSLAVLIEDTVDGVNFYTVATFAAKTAAGREAVNVTVPFTDTLRVTWAMTGTSPSFTFAVSIFRKV